MYHLVVPRVYTPTAMGDNERGGEARSRDHDSQTTSKEEERIRKKKKKKEKNLINGEPCMSMAHPTFNVPHPNRKPTYPFISQPNKK
jgi:hypothetical protein